MSDLSTRRLVPEPSEKEDGFHISIEEYLQAIISLIEELVSAAKLLLQPSFPNILSSNLYHYTDTIPFQARLAVNSVTLGDFHRPLEISKFVKDLHAGFQLLNLKNDSLRRRSDGLKYSVSNVRREWEG